MQEEQDPILKAYTSLMMSVCYGGRCVGIIFVPAGMYFGEISSENPLKGSGHDPDLKWFILSQDSICSKMRKMITEELMETYRGISVSDGIIVGLPEQHVVRPNVIRKN